MNSVPGNDLPAIVRRIDEAADADLVRMDRARKPRKGKPAGKFPLVVGEAGDVSTIERSPVRFVAEPILPRGVVTLLGGHGGLGKSTLGLVMAAHVASGTPWNGLSVDKGRALVVTLEDPADLVRWRLRAIAGVYGLSTQAIASGVLIADGTHSADAALAREAYGSDGVLSVESTAAMEQIAVIAKGCDLVVVDNASDAADLDENNRRRVRSFLRLLVQVARDNDAAVLLLAHIDKAAAKHGSNGNSFSGSTAWHNSARSRLALVEEGGAIELRHEKANLTAKAEPMRLRFTDEGVLIPHDGKPNEAAALVASADADAVLSALVKAQAVGEPVSASHSGPANAHATLSTFGLPDFLLGGAGRGRFWRAVELLLADGRAMVETVRTEQRNTRRRIVACVDSSVSSIPRTPYTTDALRARRFVGSASIDEPTNNRRTDARHQCPHCDGEGCPHCAAPLN